MTFSFILQVLGFCVGLLYLWWEYHADRKVWLASVVMPAISMWIYFSKGLYADFAINIYYLLIAVYGFIAWSRKSSSGRPTEKSVVTEAKSASQSSTDKPAEDKDELKITRTPFPVWGGIVMATGLLWAGIWWLLFHFTDSTVPIADSFTTSLSIIGLWMLARKYVEQWLIWFIVDIVSAVLYLYKGIPFYAILYALYTLIALLGYRKWLRLMPKA